MNLIMFVSNPHKIQYVNFSTEQTGDIACTKVLSRKPATEDGNYQVLDDASVTNCKHGVFDL